MTYSHISLESNIRDKITWATTCFNRKKSLLLKDKKIGELLPLLDKAIIASREEMENIGIVDECRHCEEKEGGACCGSGIENKYSGILLLINLLLGTILPQTQYIKDSCYFLGKKGCVLKAKHVICINYICKKISDKTAPETLTPLREKEGVELDLLFLLNERIKTVLGKQV